METHVEPPTDLSVKDMGRLKIAMQGLAEGKTYIQIKDELGISRPTLYALMRKQGSQELLRAEVVQIGSQIQDIIKEMLQSKSPVDRRTALIELTKIHKQFNDKVNPNLSQSTNLNVNTNIDLNPYQQQIQIHLETISRMPPTMRTLYKQIHHTVTEELTT